jgi:hypothetical protein
MSNDSPTDPIASWDSTEGRWQTPDGPSESLFVLSAPFSGRWPTSGMTRSGQAYALPKWAPPTDGSVSSSEHGLPTPRATRGGSGTGTVSLLPTPEAKLGSAGTDYARADREGSGGDDLQTRMAKLLPTPRASDGEKGGPNQAGSSGDLMLPSAVMPLLPTPTTQDGANNGGPSQHERNTPPLNTVVNLLPTPAAADGSGGRYGSDGHQMPLPGAVRLLPTPAVNDMGEGKTVEKWDDWTDEMKAKHGNGNGHGSSLAIEAQRLLPTPSASDGEGGKTSRSGSRKDEALLGGIDRLLPTPVVDPDSGNGQARDLNAEARLLPTPTVTDHKASGSSQPRTSTHATGTTLTDATVRQGDRWGEYAPAIHRWEAPMGRPAPDPTQTSTQGNPQLAPPFVEWMMGLPAGHVTDVPDMTRNEMLKALGNGVVPQQVAAALEWILTVGVTAWKRVSA